MTFNGFRPQLIEFLRQLADNNTREWFQAHRDAYDQYFLEPAREFVIAMGERFSELGEGIHAEPRVRGSIFAINRDTRFSADKTPYKAYMDLWFWQGDGQSRERPGYFFRLQPERLVLGAGMHAFPETALHRYRQAVLDPARGAQLEAAVHAVKADQLGVEIGGQTFKRVPAGLPADHARAEWLKHGALYAASEQPATTDLVCSSGFPSVCFEHFARLAPLQRWLVDVLAP